MKVARLETLFCDAGWRPWIFLKATTDGGAVGWAEITDSHGSPHGLAGVVEDLAPLVTGRDARAVEAIVWDLFRATRQSPGSVIQKAIGGIENALLDLKGKALGVPVYELFGGPTRDTVDVYWSHCGTTRARAWEVTGTKKLVSYDDVVALGREVVERGFRAFKTNIVVPGDQPQVLMPGFQGPGLDRNPSTELEDTLVRLLDAFGEGTQGKAEPIVDLNFNLTTEGVLRIARTLDGHGLMWLEVDAFDPVSLAAVRSGAAVPVCSGENLYTNRGFRPFFEAGAMDVASVAVKRAGSGHLGSSFSAMDVVVHLFYTELNTADVGFDDPDRDVYFSSKGHDVPGLYAVLHSLGVLPAERLLQLRRLGGLDGHPDIGVPGIEANSGSLGLGISKGRGIAWAKRLLGRGGRVVAMTGDGELQEGQNFEGLQAAAAHAQGNLWVVVDRNELQSDKPTEEIVALGDLETKLRAFGWYVATCDGHDHEQLAAAFAELRSVE